MQVSYYKAIFSPTHWVFLELGTHQSHLDFKILDENNNDVIPRTFYLQLLNKNECILYNETKIYPDLNPSALQESQAYWLKKITEMEVFFLHEIEDRRQQAKRKK